LLAEPTFHRRFLEKAFASVENASNDTCALR
jgi:hypothetical protein